MRDHYFPFPRKFFALTVPYFVQAAGVRTEMRCSVEMMVGSSMPLMGGNDAEERRAQQRLADIRAASVVVATAGAFEHAMLKVKDMTLG